jgi:hypothetical protein
MQVATQHMLERTVRVYSRILEQSAYHFSSRFCRIGTTRAESKYAYMFLGQCL